MMRTYLVVILMIFGMMGAYFALLPLAESSGVDASIPMASPG